MDPAGYNNPQVIYNNSLVIYNNPSNTSKTENTTHPVFIR
jgi:hypothetical protein